MKRVLCDENMPHKLRAALASHKVATAKYMGFNGLKNGALLDAAETAGFEVLLTGDKTIEYETSLEYRKIAVVALSAPHWRIIKECVNTIALAIEGAKPGSFNRVDCGRFSRGPNAQSDHAV